MTLPGGSTTEAGIKYQNQIAALFLGRLIDPGPWPENEQIIEVRSEHPCAHVDDIVVRFQDHTDYIQVKLRLGTSGDTWTKFWKHMMDQRWTEFAERDQLILVIGESPDWVSDLDAICIRAFGSCKDLELAPLDQQADEWFSNLSEGQKKFLNDRVIEPLSRIPVPAQKGNPSATEQANRPAGEPVVPELYLHRTSLFQLFSRMQVWTHFGPRTIKDEHAKSYMPKASQAWPELFNALELIAGENACLGKSISQKELIHELTGRNISLAEVTPAKTGISNLYTTLSLPFLDPDVREIILKTRKRELKNYRKYLDANPVLVVTGIDGAGKTDLVRVMVDQKPESVPPPFWFDFSQAPDTTLRSLLEKLAAYFEHTYAEWEDLLKAGSKSLINYFVALLNRETTFWLIFDSVEIALEKGKSTLKDDGIDAFFSALLANTHHAKVILISSIMPVRKNGRDFVNVLDPDARLIPPLGGIPIRQAKEILRKTIPFAMGSDEVLEKLVKGVEGNPFAIQELMRFIKAIGLEQTLSELEGASLQDLRSKFDQYIRMRTSEKEYAVLTTLAVLRKMLPFNAIVWICQTNSGIIFRLIDEHLLIRAEPDLFGLSKLVRNACYPNDDPDFAKRSHSRAMEYYKNHPLSTEPVSITDLEESILEWHFHAIEAKEYLSAYQALFDTLADIKLYQWGEYDRLAQLCQQCLEGGDAINPEFQIHILERLGRSQRKINHFTDSINSFQRGLEINQNISDAVRARLLVGKAESMHGKAKNIQNRERLQTLEQALDTCNAALNLMKLDTQTKTFAEGLHVKGSIYCAMGKHAEAEGYYHQAKEIYEYLNEFVSLANIWGDIGTIHHDHFDFSKALDCYAQVVKYSSQTRNLWGKLVTLINLGDIEIQQKHYSQARSYFDEGYAIARKFHSTDKAEQSGMGLTEALFGEGEFEKGMEILRQMKDLFGIQTTPWKKGTYQRLIARSFDMRNQTLLAEQNYQLAIQTLSDPINDCAYELPPALLDYGKFLAANHRKEEALRYFTQARSAYQAIHNPYGIGFVDDAIAGLVG